MNHVANLQVQNSKLGNSGKRHKIAIIRVILNKYCDVTTMNPKYFIAGMYVWIQ